MEGQNMSNVSQASRDGKRKISLSSVESSRSCRSPFTGLDTEDNVNETPKRQKVDNSCDGLSVASDVDSIPCSPWEIRRMKGEVIALKTKVSHLEDTIEHLHKVRREVEEVCHKEKRLLEIEIARDKDTIKQLELRLDFSRKSAQEAKVAHAHAEKNLSEMKMKMEKKILTLIEDNSKLSEELKKCANNDVKPDFNVLRTENKTLALEEQLKATQQRVSELEVKLREAGKNLQTIEVQNAEIQALKVKVETLESEKTIFEESKKFINRAARASELEKELQYAKEIIRSLNESVKGKLLLEEQMATIEHRLQRTENLERQITQLEVTRGELLAKISDYEAIGISGGPTAVKREINRLQLAELTLTAEEGQLRSKVDSLKRELQDAQRKIEETKKQLAETVSSNERLSRFISRLQKKTSLVTRERDSYRQQLDTYEKEITAYQNTEVAPNISTERIPALERAIEGYKELVSKYEADLEALEGRSQKDEIKKLKDEIDKLKGELEYRALKGDFNINSKILHFKMNPAAIAMQQAEEKQKALLEEVERLRIIVSSGSHSGTAPTSSLQAQEIAELQQKHDLKIQRLKEAFKASSHEYRQACYQLFGWRVDRTKEGQYKLSSQYAESPDDYLFFIVNEDGVNMIETPFSSTLTTFIERHLKLQHSVPMFLNAVQSDLFDQQTATNVIATCA
ncbi:mitotic spindle assembly checkpoint protein MAD1 [Copidosoma floridanum]|uniref:mitotic spindle assembly checkpoint protein MAD1 n=1 Tax=Copidosoma floridanum TaxID=29053 RepID=UPI0006C9A142|nr:mitotic spindle assembly checkpoint protein MAD1 [Copidosoma floridanum]XP_014207577.1 mitotic spindle assembly checkpoint protein MAD1 [Copidosoma floridanum]